MNGEATQEEVDEVARASAEFHMAFVSGIAGAKSIPAEKRCEALEKYASEIIDSKTANDPEKKIKLTMMAYVTEAWAAKKHEQSPESPIPIRG